MKPLSWRKGRNKGRRILCWVVTREYCKVGTIPEVLFAVHGAYLRMIGWCEDARSTVLMVLTATTEGLCSWRFLISLLLFRMVCQHLCVSYFRSHFSTFLSEIIKEQFLVYYFHRIGSVRIYPRTLMVWILRRVKRRYEWKMRIELPILNITWYRFRSGFYLSWVSSIC